MKNRTYLFALMITLSPIAHATKFMCVTSPRVPHVAYQYNNDEEGNSSISALRRLVAPGENIAALLKGIGEGELPPQIQQSRWYYGPEEIGGSFSKIKFPRNHQKTLLEVPFLDPNLRGSFHLRNTTGELVFEGQVVQELDYTFCGKD